MTNFCLGGLLAISIINTYLISDEIGGDNPMMVLSIISALIGIVLIIDKNVDDL